MKQILLFVLICGGVMYINTRCTKDTVKPLPVSNCTDTISFSNKIQPFMMQNCATSGCHDAGTAADGKIYETHTQISSFAGIALKAMRGDGAQLMPLGYTEPLPDSLIQQFDCWIQQGKQNN